MSHDDFPDDETPRAFNTKTGRACIQAPFGVACYQGTVDDDGTFHGTHCGIVNTPEDADAWLRGEQPKGLLTVYD